MVNLLAEIILGINHIKHSGTRWAGWTITGVGILLLELYLALVIWIWNGE
jgi:hypothetical protein